MRVPARCAQNNPPRYGGHDGGATTRSTGGDPGHGRVEQVEYEQPRKAVEQAGGTVTLLSVHSGSIQAMNGDIDKGDRLTVDAVVSDASTDSFDGLVLPGGTINPDRLRVDRDAVAFVRDFVSAGKPTGAICHGPWILVEADVVRGRSVTSFHSIRTDLRNAGAQVADQEVVTDRALVTSRSPDDLPAFCSKIVEQFAQGRHPAGAQA